MSSGPSMPRGGPRDSGAIELPPRPNVLADEHFPPAPQQERSRRARDGLLEASLALFGQNGYDATTVDEIARRAGVAVGGFYLHFRSKRQVLQVLMDTFLLELDARLGTLHDAGQLAHALLTIDLDSPYAGVYRAWREAALQDASIAALDAEIEAWTSARIAAALHTTTVKTGARGTVDLQSFAWMLSVLWWQILENAHLDRDALMKSAAALVRAVLFEDAAGSPALHALPVEETS